MCICSRREASDAEAGTDVLQLGVGSSVGGGVVLARGHRCGHLAVELDLRLRARGAHAHLDAAGREVLQHVRRGGHVDVAHLARGQLGLLERLEVLGQGDGLAGQLLGRVSAEVLHHLLDLVGAALAGLHDADGLLLLEAVFLVDAHQQVVERHAVVLGPGGDLADQADGGRGVLVAHLVVGQEAEALLAAADVLLLALVHADAVGDPLEARELVVELDALLVGDLADQLGGHDGLHHELVALQLAELLLVRDDVPREHHGRLVAVQDHPLALVVAAHNGEAVGIRIAGDDEVGAHLVAQLHAHGHGLGVLGVGRDDGREVAVDDHLLGHDVDVLEAPRAQAQRDDDAARAVQGRIDDVQVLLAQDDVLVHHGLLDGRQVVIVHLAADDLDEVLVGHELHVLDLHLVHLVDDARVVRGQHLGAVVPVGLVSVVLLRVVRGRDVHAGLGAELADGKRDLGRGAQRLEEVGLDAVGREDVGHRLGEGARVVAAVVAHHDAQVLAAGEGLEDVVGEALRGHADDVLVHAVRARAHDAAQAARAELEVLVEGLDQVGLVRVVEHRLHGGPRLLVEACAQPGLCLGGAFFQKLFVHLGRWFYGY